MGCGSSTTVDTSEVVGFRARKVRGGEQKPAQVQIAFENRERGQLFLAASVPDEGDFVYELSVAELPFPLPELQLPSQKRTKVDFGSEPKYFASSPTGQRFAFFRHDRKQLAVYDLASDGEWIESFSQDMGDDLTKQINDLSFLGDQFIGMMSGACTIRIFNLGIIRGSRASTLAIAAHAAADRKISAVKTMEAAMPGAIDSSDVLVSEDDLKEMNEEDSSSLMMDAEEILASRLENLIFTFDCDYKLVTSFLNPNLEIVCMDDSESVLLLFSGIDAKPYGFYLDPWFKQTFPGSYEIKRQQYSMDPTKHIHLRLTDIDKDYEKALSMIRLDHSDALIDAGKKTASLRIGEKEFNSDADSTIGGSSSSGSGSSSSSSSGSSSGRRRSSTVGGSMIDERKAEYNGRLGNVCDLHIVHDYNGRFLTVALFNGEVRVYRRRDDDERIAQLKGVSDSPDSMIDLMVPNFKHCDTVFIYAEVKADRVSAVRWISGRRFVIKQKRQKCQICTVTEQMMACDDGLAGQEMGLGLATEEFEYPDSKPATSLTNVGKVGVGGFFISTDSETCIWAAV